VGNLFCRAPGEGELHGSSGAQNARAFRMTGVLSSLGGRGGRLAQGDGELGLAGFGGVIEGVTGTVAFAGFKEESAFDAVGQASETGFPVDIRADFEVEFPCAHESVGDVDFDFGEVDGFVVSAGDDEVGGARTNAAVDYRNGSWVGVLGQGWSGED